MTELHTERLACTEDRHVLATDNPWSRDTWCVCGKVRVPWNEGDDPWHTTWHEHWVYDHAGKGARLLGWERYRMPACLCHEDGVVVEEVTPDA